MVLRKLAPMPDATDRATDSHFTEPPNLWLDHIEPAFKDRAPHLEHQEDTDIFVCDTGEMFPVADFLSRHGGKPRRHWDQPA